jgi:hypothetical protein
MGTGCTMSPRGHDGARCMQRPPGSEVEAGQCSVARAVVAETAGPVTAATTIVGSVWLHT